MSTSSFLSALSDERINFNKTLSRELAWWCFFKRFFVDKFVSIKKLNLLMNWKGDVCLKNGYLSIGILLSGIGGK